MAVPMEVIINVTGLAPIFLKRLNITWSINIPTHPVTNAAKVIAKNKFKPKMRLNTYAKSAPNTA
jgi:hypothetical protein